MATRIFAGNSTRQYSAPIWHFGFSLLEILISLAIIGLLAAISIPLYSEHIATERRSEAEITLSRLASALEKFYFENNSYKNANLSHLGFSETVAHYQFSILSATDEKFELAATPLDTHVKCGILYLNSLGEKNMSGPGTIEECW